MALVSLLDDQPRPLLTTLREDYLMYLAGRTMRALEARRGCLGRMAKPGPVRSRSYGCD